MACGSNHGRRTRGARPSHPTRDRAHLRARGAASRGAAPDVRGEGGTRLRGDQLRLPGPRELRDGWRGPQVLRPEPRQPRDGRLPPRGARRGRLLRAALFHEHVHGDGRASGRRRTRGLFPGDGAPGASPRPYEVRRLADDNDGREADLWRGCSNGPVALPDGVTAARLTLDQLVKVRILLRQLYESSANLGKGELRFSQDLFLYTRCYTNVLTRTIGTQTSPQPATPATPHV